MDKDEFLYWMRLIIVIAAWTILITGILWLLDLL